MADAEISALVDGTTPDDADDFVVARAGSTLKLTWAALKAAIGGSTPVHTRESFSGDFVAVSDGGQETLPWTTSQGPDTLLDITDPTQPDVLESGLYAIMADTIQNDPISVGGYYIATLTIGGSAQVTSQSPPSTLLGSGGQYPQAATLVIIRYLAPGDTIEVKVELFDGSSDNTFGQSGSIVQRLS